MKVVAHHRIRMHADCEAFGEQSQALLDPVLAVLERVPGIFVDPAQQRPAYAALDAVEGTAGTGGCKLGTSLDHCDSMAGDEVARCRGNPDQDVGTF